jgi:hypothetical protein
VLKKIVHQHLLAPRIPAKGVTKLEKISGTKKSIAYELFNFIFSVDSLNRLKISCLS